MLEFRVSQHSRLRAIAIAAIVKSTPEGQSYEMAKSVLQYWLQGWGPARVWLGSSLSSYNLGWDHNLDPIGPKAGGDFMNIKNWARHYFALKTIILTRRFGVKVGRRMLTVLHPAFNCYEIHPRPWNPTLFNFSVKCNQQKLHFSFNKCFVRILSRMQK